MYNTVTVYIWLKSLRLRRTNFYWLESVMMDQAGAFACKWLLSRLELVCYNLVNGLKKNIRVAWV